MAMFYDSVERLNSMLNGFVWGPVMLALLVGTGIWFTLRTGLFQLTHMDEWWRNTVGAVRNDAVRRTGDKQAISQFQSLCTALAGTIGTGNIVGVATAIATGGPGAIFWMWVAAFFGTMTSFSEKVLGILYRYKDENGAWVGGAMIYMERGLGRKWLACAFSAFCVMASFGIGNMSQANSIAAAMETAFGAPRIASGTIVALAAMLVVLGGIQRIAVAAEKIVPLMAGLYMLGTLTAIFLHIENLLPSFFLIFREAFCFRAGAAGTAGYGISLAMRRGISRGVFSNEAGLGSSVMAHTASDVKEPVVQGMWGIFEVFVDTFVVCTLTAMTVLTSGVYDVEAYAPTLGAGLPVGAALTGAAFAESFGMAGAWFVALTLMAFAFTSILSWHYYGERGVAYLFGSRAVSVYKILFICAIVPGATMGLNLVWDISDTCNGLMAMPNLLALCLLSGRVVAELHRYRSKKRAPQEQCKRYV